MGGSEESDAEIGVSTNAGLSLSSDTTYFFSPFDIHSKVLG